MQVIRGLISDMEPPGAPYRGPTFQRCGSVVDTNSLLHFHTVVCNVAVKSRSAHPNLYKFSEGVSSRRRKMATSVRNWTIFATTADNGGYDFLRSALSTEGLTILEGLRSNILPVFDSHLALEDSIAHLWSRTTILGSLLLSTLRNLLSLGAIVAGAALIWVSLTLLR